MHQQEKETSSNSSDVPQKQLQSGKWLPSEHQKFLEGVELYKTQWDMIAHHVETRDASQVRSHAQKFYNKRHNDEQKIGNMKVQLRPINGMAKTRSMQIASSSNSIIQESPEKSKENTSKPKNNKNELGSNQQKIKAKKAPKENSESSPKISTPRNSVPHTFEYSQASFFMERVYPQISPCPIEEFSVFTLIEWGDLQTEQRMDTEEEKSFVEKNY